MIHCVGHVCRGIGGFVRACSNLLLPPRCAACDRDLAERDVDPPFCKECLARLGPETWEGCRRCGAAASNCRRCRNTSLRFDAAVVLGGYHEGLREVVLRMKRSSHEALSLSIGRLFAQRRGALMAAHRADLIVPVPMFWRRRLQRGINSPDVLAHCLGKSLGVPVRRNILVRCRNTRPQAELSPTRRLENVRGAFRVRRPRAVENARVLLVDDVLTTGATCNEAAKMLKQAGAAWVVATVVARAEGK